MKKQEVQASLAVVIPVGRSLQEAANQIYAVSTQLASNKSRTLVLAINRASEFGKNEIAKLLVDLKLQKVDVKIVDATAKVGAAYARNLGWQSVKADFYLFCDDDDIVSENWVDEMASHLKSSTMVGGALDYHLLNGPHYAKLFKNNKKSHSLKFSHLEFAPTCNLGVTKEVLVRTGGFDETFLSGEDIDFCWRAQYLGLRLDFVLDCIVHYKLRVSAVSTFVQYYFYGRIEGKLLLKHKKNGAKRLIRETQKDLVKLAGTFFLAPFSRARRVSLYQKSGTMIGRLVSTIVDRIWVL